MLSGTIPFLSFWAERKVTPALSEALWGRLGMARFILRKAPVGVELVRDDITTDPGQGRVRITAKARTPDASSVAGIPPAETSRRSVSTRAGEFTGAE